MRSRRRAAFLRVLAVTVVTMGGFVLLQANVRAFETQIAATVLHAFGADRAHVVPPSSIQVFTDSGPAFRAVITPSCSAAGSLLALACLASLAPRRNGRWAAAGVAMGTVFVGNVARIAASIGVGLVAGRASLVLFHDWVGSAFTFAYTLGGFILMLYLQLPEVAREPS